MAQSMVSDGLAKIQQTLNGSASDNPKIADLAVDTKDVHDKSARITTDYGVRQNNTGGSSLVQVVADVCLRRF